MELANASGRIGPSDRTGVTECSACGLCATCCGSVKCFGDLSRVAIVISGASGPCASKVNGVFYATDELSGGRFVFTSSAIILISAHTIGPHPVNGWLLRRVIRE